VLTTDQKGVIAELEIARQAAELGIGVWTPHTIERCDLIFDLRPELVRVQCKWSPQNGDVIVVRCCSNRRNRDGLVRRSYSVAEIDAFAAYCPDTDRCYLLPIVGLAIAAQSSSASGRRETTKQPGSTGRAISNSRLHCAG